jgi:hypothetical protein
MVGFLLPCTANFFVRNALLEAICVCPYVKLTHESLCLFARKVLFQIRSVRLLKTNMNLP